MQTIQDVEKAISLNEELLSETKKRIQETSAKLSEVRGNVKRIEAEIKDAKEKRQAALARGGDSNGLNNFLKKSESELELETETITGLEDFLKELRVKESELHQKLDALPKRGLQLQAVEIAKKYNEQAEQLAVVAKALNGVHYELDKASNGKQGRTVFLPDGIEYLDKIVRLTFDNEALDLDAYIRKNVTCFPYEPTEDQKYFYKWQTHRQDLISGK